MFDLLEMLLIGIPVVGLGLPLLGIGLPLLAVVGLPLLAVVGIPLLLGGLLLIGLPVAAMLVVGSLGVGGLAAGGAMLYAYLVSYFGDIGAFFGFLGTTFSGWIDAIAAFFTSLFA